MPQQFYVIVSYPFHNKKLGFLKKTVNVMKTELQKIFSPLKQTSRD